MKKPAFALLGILSASVLSGAETVRLVASDLLEPALRPVAQQWEAEGVAVEVLFQGSIQAEAALREGTADLAILARPQVETSLEFSAWPYAFFAVGLAVVEANPLRQLDQTQLRQVLGDVGTAARWSDLGFSGSWLTREILRYSIERDNNLLLELMRARALGDAALTPNILFEPDVTTLQARMLENPSILAIVPVTEITAGMRAVRIAKNDGGATFAPSSDNLLVGDYELSLRFELAALPERLEAVAPIIRRLLGEEIATSLSAHQFVALPETERREILLDVRAASE